MSPENALENATHAMKMADDWLDVPQVRGEEMGCGYGWEWCVGVASCDVGVCEKLNSINKNLLLITYHVAIKWNILSACNPTRVVI